MGRPRVYDEELRGRLLDAAADAIATDGVVALSLRRVSAAAGTTTNAVYTIFGSREALVDAVAARADESLTRAQERLRKEEPLRDLVRLAVAYRQWAVENPSLYAVLLGERAGDEPPALPALDPPSPAGALRDGDGMPRSVGPLVDVVGDLGEAGLLREAPARTVTWSIWAALHGAVALDLAFAGDQSAADREDAYLSHVGAVLRGWLVDAPELSLATAGAREVRR